MFANSAPGGAAGGVIGLHNIHGAGTPLGPLGSHSTTPTPQQLQQLQHQSSSPPSGQPNPTLTASSTSVGPAAGEATGAQQLPRRPTGLPLFNLNGNNGSPHYPAYGQSSTAPLPPGGSTAPIQSSNALLHRNASFSFSSPHSHPQNPPATTTPSSAPPSATLPHSYRSPSVSGSGPTMQAVPSTSHPSQGRSGQTPSLANHNALTPNSNVSDPSKGQPTPPNARPAIMSAGSTVKPIGTNATGSSPASHSNLSGLAFAPHPYAGPQPAQLPSEAPTGPGCGPPSSDASRFFNTYLYDYLLKQGLFEVAQVFVTSGAEMELVDGPERTAMAEAPAVNTVSSHKRRRSDGSPTAANSSSSPPQPLPNGCASDAAGLNNSNKTGAVASEPIANERTLSSSGSTVSNTSHYGFNHVAGNRTGTANDANSQSANSDPLTNGPTNTGASAGASNTSIASPRSSPRTRHVSSLDSLPKPKLAMDTDQGFLFEWWTIFWDVFRAKTGRASPQAQPAQLYAQTVAAASMGMSLEHGGMSKARRDAMGVFAVANPGDVQKGYVNDRIVQQYNMITPQMHLAQLPAHSTASAVRLQPHPHLLQQQQQQQQQQHHQQQQQKHQLFLEQNARQQQHAMLQQQQMQQQAHLARQRLHHQELQQQQQEAHLHHQQHLQHQQQQHAQQMHQQMYPDQFPGAQLNAMQRSMVLNGRRVTGMGPPGQEHITGMMPPPAVQHGSPLNPHQQPPYRPSRPPSRSGVPHAASPFAPNPNQPPREPSRASNHANSPAFQNHPRTPSSHTSAVLPQTAVLPPNRRGTPGSEDQERKKRRLNDPPGNPVAESPGNAQSQHQLQQAHHQMQMQMQMQMHQRNVMPNGGSTPIPGPQGSPTNPNVPQGLDAYKQSIHAQHAQAIAAANSMNGGSPNTSTAMSPPKTNGSKPTENHMPPPPGRNPTQPPTPQPTPNGNRPAESHSTPLPTIVTPSTDVSQSNQPPRPASQNAIASGGKVGPSEILEDLAAAQQQRSISVPQSQDSGKPVGTSGSAGLNANGDRSQHETLSQGDIKVQNGDGNQDLWLMGNGSGGGQQMNRMLGEGGDSPAPDANGPPSGDIAVPGNNDSLDHLFGSGDPTGLEFDATLFEAFINYDPTSTGAEFG